MAEQNAVDGSLMSTKATAAASPLIAVSLSPFNEKRGSAENRGAFGFILSHSETRLTKTPLGARDTKTDM